MVLNSQHKNTYNEFVEKFKPKKTTDDCMTPAPVYEAVRDYVFKNYKVDGLVIDRPFWPGANYQKKAEAYGSDALVLDNPPFSKLSEIISFYLKRNIKFFMFMPALTGLDIIIKFKGQVSMLIGASIVYENGAKVPTNFVTNLTTEPLVVADQALIKALKQANHQKPAKIKNVYPPRLLSSAELFRKGQNGCSFTIANTAQFVKKVDAVHHNKREKYNIFGGALVVDQSKAEDLKAEELKAAELKAEELKAAELKAASEYRVLLIPKDLNKEDKKE